MNYKWLKWLNIVPSFILILSLTVFYIRNNLLKATAQVSEMLQVFLEIWLIIILLSLFIVLGLMVAYIIHLVFFNKKMSFYKKLIWLLALWIFNVVSIPLYYQKEIESNGALNQTES